MIYEKIILILFCLWNNFKLFVMFIRRVMMIERKVIYVFYIV